MIKNRIEYRHFLSLLLLLFTLSLAAQTSITSPYSRYGIGDLTANANDWNFSMGGTGIALRSPYHVNIVNPASYTAFDSTSFVFEGGVIFSNVTLKTTTQTASRTYASVGYLNIGFPVTRWWKTTLGLLPYSNVGYNINSDVTLPKVGLVSRIYSGSGGINRFLWGNGFRLGRHLSIGINASYLFGTMSRESASTFPDSTYFINFRETNNITVSGLYFDYGVQYTAKINKDVRLTAGGIFSTNSQVRATTDLLATTYFASGGSEFVKDTIKSAPGVHGSITVPMMFGLGISFDRTDKWLVGADFRWQNWEKYRAFGLSDSLVNSYSISAGAEFIPDVNTYTNYLKKIRYRLGARYSSTYLMLRGKHLNDYSVTLGFGLPLRGMKTGINLGFELGSRGTTQSDLIKETYFNFVLGFSIYERWFIKRKYF